MSPAAEKRSVSVEVWHASLSADESVVRAAANDLAPDELTLAEQFHQDVHRRRFVLRRSLVRKVLAELTGDEPARLKIVAESDGKPRLEGTRALEFSLSHSGELALLAVCREAAVGVDIEQVDEQVDWQDLAERYYSEGESAHLRGLSPELGRESFFASWTRKEALCKAVGTGLSREWLRLQLESGARPPAPYTEWSVRNLDVAPGYRAALAARAPDLEVVRRDLP